MGYWGLLFVVLAIQDAAGLFVPRTRSSIMGGEDAYKGQWPWMAHLSSISVDGNALDCGGTLLNKDWVLTAAHCVDPDDNIVPEKSFVQLGLHSLQAQEDSDVIVRAMSQILIHPEYDYIGNYVNDIALVKVNQSVDFTNLVRPVKLPEADDSFILGSECWVTGWGDTELGAPRDGILQQLNVPIINEKDCLKAYPDLTSGSMCAGYWKGGRDTCKGDSGGPLLCYSDDDYVQVGIIGFRIGCTSRTKPGLYTRVANYINFIKETINTGTEASAKA